VVAAIDASRDQSAIVTEIFSIPSNYARPSDRQTIGLSDR
jgi:hypothetical protein